jgi:hypothetical protein
MATRADLEDWVAAAVKANGGKAGIVPIAKHIWDNHETELRGSGDLFYTWGYDIRWAGQRLQKAGKLKKTKEGTRGVWVLLQ